MEVVLGALPIVLPKLAELLQDEYNLQKEVKSGIRFLQAELESMKAALEDISKTPPDQLSSQDKIWARNVRDLSFDIEDNIDMFIVQVKGNRSAINHGFKKLIYKILGSLMQPKIRRKIAIDIKDIKSRVIEVHERRRRYEINHPVDKPVKVDPRALVRYEDMTKLVGIDEAADEVINLLIGGNNQVSKQHDKIVSIVGFGGLGKTTLANVVYENLRAQFDCSAFVSVSRTPDMDKLLEDMFNQLYADKVLKDKFYQPAEDCAASINVIDRIRKFLPGQRYLIIIDDIWEISYWNMIRCALPDHSEQYRILTTTRIWTVAEHIGGAYKMKPLSIENSRTLMYGRIFGKENKDKCLDDVNEQLAEVSHRILKKCAGVPLAIITVASLLASKGRNSLEWYDVCNSIGAGLEENNDDNMRNVLSLSYYDMPSHLRACLLYLSMFPQDYEIDKDHLIWLWIAEGFIQSTNKEKGLFEMGESYLNQLVNRSMIHPIYDNYNSTLESCRVHDMVLDLIRYLSSEESFITIRNDVGYSSASEKVRRLSLQNSKVGHGKLEATMSMEHVRSVVVFPPAIDQVPNLENFRVLRILDLEGCDLSLAYSLKYLVNLHHLRYLGLRNTFIDRLPEEIGNLRLLQTLELRGNFISNLPSTVTLLTHLMCLHIDSLTKVPKGIKRLIAINDLSSLGIRDDSTYIIEELGHLKELRVLEIMINKPNNGLDKSLVECLNKLHKIQSLKINIESGDGCNLDGWVIDAPRYLRRLFLYCCWLSTLPAWVNPSLLLDLSFLNIGVRGLQHEDLEILGRLPALRYLFLRVDHEDLRIRGRFTIGACLFPCMIQCSLWGFGGPVVFQQGSMLRLAQLWLEFPVHETKEITGGFDLGLGNLPSLQQVDIMFQSGGASKEEVDEAEAAFIHVTNVHPNHPTLCTYI